MNIMHYWWLGLVSSCRSIWRTSCTYSNRPGNRMISYMDSRNSNSLRWLDNQWVKCCWISHPPFRDNHCNSVNHYADIHHALQSLIHSTKYFNSRTSVSMYTIYQTVIHSYLELVMHNKDIDLFTSEGEHTIELKNCDLRFRTLSPLANNIPFWGDAIPLYSFNLLSTYNNSLIHNLN